MTAATTGVAPPVQRQRHEIRRRTLQVLRVESPAPWLRRIVLGGEELAGFHSAGFDDHVKVFLPGADPAAAPMRDFTPRHHDAARGELWIDFFLHDAGPATQWAASAAVGDRLAIGGPKGSWLLDAAGVDLHVLIGDETAVPAISRRLDELPATARAEVVLELGTDLEVPALTSRAAVRVHVARRAAGGVPGDAPGAALLALLRPLEIPPRLCFVWAAAESAVARAVRSHFVDARGWDPRWIKAAGYWQRDAAGRHEVIDAT